MCNALKELKSKGIDISPEEEQGARIAILLHDIGHGPFSHALENILVEGMPHESISLLIMQELNKQFDGKLTVAIEIFTRTHPKKFLHQLVSGQLDVDRMDYLTRDSFFTGVNEGVIGYDRILKMLTVQDGELMVEEKGIYSIEKFLVARRLMYWQVYLHKTVLCAEQMLQRIIKRAKFLNAHSSLILDSFIRKAPDKVTLAEFCNLDDYDVVAAIKEWCNHPDPVLSFLSRSLTDRKLLKIKYSSTPVDEQVLKDKIKVAMQQLSFTEEEAGWLVFTGEAVSNTYNFEDEHILILFKDGSIRDISEVDNALISPNLMSKVKKYYICFLQ